MNDSISLQASSNNGFVDSMIQQNHSLYCSELGGPETLTIQPGCFDWSSFGVALFACLIAILTCVFTILMYRYVKRQLDLAETQLINQIKDNKTNEQTRINSMNATKTYVEQIKLQILNNSLINLIEKKQRFLQDYDYIHGYLSEHSILLKEGPVIQKDTSLRKTIDNIIVNLCLINDILALFEKNNDLVVHLSDTINTYIEELKNKEVIASDMDDIDKWLDEFHNTEDNYSRMVEQAIEQIKNNIKQEK